MLVYKHFLNLCFIKNKLLKTEKVEKHRCNCYETELGLFFLSHYCINSFRETSSTIDWVCVSRFQPIKLVITTVRASNYCTSWMAQKFDLKLSDLLTNYKIYKLYDI